ncbi:MAG: hypothetical protein OJF52_002440 [Nitrospira sp.]|jgi:hypothetical protein|nr:MAG: hypothetical protein OJF52_002440 [Nitrospira sp.]
MEIHGRLSVKLPLRLRRIADQQMQFGIGDVQVLANAADPRVLNGLEQRMIP